MWLDCKEQIRHYLAADPSELELSARGFAVASGNPAHGQGHLEFGQTFAGGFGAAEERGDRIAEIHTLLKIGDYQLVLREFLPAGIGGILWSISSWIGATPAAMLVTLLPVAASLLPIGTELEIDAGMGFYAPPILFTGW
jgi:hypothetical protein